MRRAAVTVSLLVAAALAAAPAAGARGAVARVARVGSAPSSQQLQLVLPLVADTAGIQRYAMSVATPGSRDYARYQPVSRLARWFGASRNTRARVVRFLRGAGATQVKIDATGLFADATITVARAERAFGTQLARFRAANGTRFVAPITARATSAAADVPVALRGVVDSVVGLDTRPLVSRAALARSAHAAAAGVPSALPHTGTSSGCAPAQATQGFTPNQYLTAYGLSNLQAHGVTGAGETVALIEIDGFNDGDIDAFAQCFGLGVPRLNAYGVGVKHALPAGGETTLDLEVLDSSAPGLKEIDIYESDASASEVLKAMTAPLENHGHEPQVVSASLGLCETDTVGAIGTAGLDDVEAALAFASATGITYLASSGDDGSADCTNDRDEPVHKLAVNYPASSWWVTGVGGTNFELNPANQIESQIVWNDGAEQPGSAGGGGLSSRFVRPDYQKGAQSANRRAVPDVSMLADIQPGYAIYCTAGPPDCDPSNPWEVVGGTSAATPLLAGGFALVDQLLHSVKREDLGLVNPLLYELGKSSARTSVFSDVTVGNNDVFPYVGGTSALGCCSASTGYDDASGWGSVNLTNFAQYALAAQPPVVSVKLALPGHQHVISSKQIKATVSCTASCILGAYAEVKIGGAKPFEVDSKLALLKAKGSVKLALKLSKKELGKLRTARRTHKRITATVFGLILNRSVFSVIDAPGEAVQARTGGKTLNVS